MQNVSIDFGHNSIKGITHNNQVVIPSVLGEKKKYFVPNLSDNQSNINYLQICYEEREYFFGDLARRQSELCIQNVNDEDLNEYETKVMIIAAVACLAEERNVNLVVSLPLTHYRDKKQAEDFAEMFKGLHQMEFFDFDSGQYKKKKFNIINTDVKPQGFLALMSLLLDQKGSLRKDKLNIANALVVVIDPGYYSTDVYVSHAMEPIIKIPLKPIPGMVSVYKLLAEFLYERFNVRKELYQVEQYARSKQIILGNKIYNISEAVDSACEQLTRKIVSEINNLLPFWPEVNYWYLAGGGAEPLYDDFKTRYKGIDLMDRALMANAVGGLYWSRRLWP